MCCDSYHKIWLLEAVLAEECTATRDRGVHFAMLRISPSPCSRRPETILKCRVARNRQCGFQVLLADVTSACER